MILEKLSETDTDLIVLAGYMSILDPELIETYRDRIINIHPSLIPKFCGKGFYGKRVHRAVLETVTSRAVRRCISWMRESIPGKSFYRKK